MGTLNLWWRARAIIHAIACINKTIHILMGWMLEFDGCGTGNLHLYLRDNLLQKILRANKWGQNQLSIDVNWCNVYDIPLNYQVFLLLIKLSMHHLNTIFLRCFPYHFACKFKCKCLIFYSILRAYSKQEPSISSPAMRFHVLLPNTKIIARVGVTKDKTFVLLKQEGLWHTVILFPGLFFPIFYPRTNDTLHCWFLQYIRIHTKLSSCKLKLISSSPNIASAPVASNFSISCWRILASCILAVTYITLLFSVDSPPRWDQTPSLICFTPPQLLLAGPIPHSFDFTRHPTYPNTTVHGREYFLCHMYDLPLTHSELAQWLISWCGWVQFWNALNSFQKVSIILWGNIVRTAGFGLGQGGTWDEWLPFKLRHGVDQLIWL